LLFSSFILYDATQHGRGGHVPRMCLPLHFTQLHSQSHIGSLQALKRVVPLQQLQAKSPA
jgi:hypothetical protein